MFMKVPAIIMEACNILGSSSNVTILRNDGFLFVFSTLISFDVKAKKATSLPAIKKDSMKNMKRAKISIVVAAGVMTSIWLKV